MKEVPFSLEVGSDGWPPFPVEWLWLEERDHAFLVKSVPLFVSGLAVDDVIVLSDFMSSGEVTGWTLITPSERSVIWIADLGGNQLDFILSAFRRIGCNTDILTSFKHAAIDVPSHVSCEQVDEILAHLDPQEYAVAFPVDRQTRASDDESLTSK